VYDYDRVVGAGLLQGYNALIWAVVLQQVCVQAFCAHLRTCRHTVDW
jgi:hypothetical protein